MSSAYRNRTLALAGIFQATHLVQQIARKGMAETRLLESTIGSLFHRTPDEDVADIYGGVDGLADGLRLLLEQLGGKRDELSMEVTRYVIGIMHLERKLNTRPDMLDKVAEGMDRAQAQTEHFGALHANVFANLAGIYSDTISQLGPRIIVSGEQGYLNNPDNANKVRALLLAAMRSAILWRQVGGRRWQLIFKRGEMLRQAQGLVNTVAAP